MQAAYIFPGQGSQYVGMGKDFYENFEASKKVFDTASKILGIDMRKLCFESDEETLKQTKYTQIALFTVEMAILEALKEQKIDVKYFAGLSLGEYSAICTSGIADFKTLLPIVRKRGEYMQEFIEPRIYAMAAVIGLEDERVEEGCTKLSKHGFIVPVNYNCPGQVVISGEEKVIDMAFEEFKDAKRVLKLNLNSPFHTEKLNKAKAMLYEILKHVEFKKTENRVYKNMDACIYTKNDNMADILANHIVSPVRFGKSIQNMIDDGVDTFIEIGPGKTLTGFVKKVNKNVKTINIEKIEDLNLN